MFLCVYCRKIASINLRLYHILHSGKKCGTLFLGVTSIRDEIGEGKTYLYVHAECILLCRHIVSMRIHCMKHNSVYKEYLLEMLSFQKHNETDPSAHMNFFILTKLTTKIRSIKNVTKESELICLF